MSFETKEKIVNRIDRDIRRHMYSLSWYLYMKCTCNVQMMTKIFYREVDLVFAAKVIVFHLFHVDEYFRNNYVCLYYVLGDKRVLQR